MIQLQCTVSNSVVLYCIIYSYIVSNTVLYCITCSCTVLYCMKYSSVALFQIQTHHISNYASFKFLYQYHFPGFSFSADTLVTNSVGQTASDIAEFWQHRQVAEIISKTNEGQASAATGLPVTVRKTNYFCDSPLDRMSQRRTDDEWLDALKTDPKTVYIVLTQLSPIVKSSSGAPSYVLARFPFQRVKGFLDSKATLIFLGVEHPTTDEDKPPSSVGWFAVDGGTLSEEQIGGLEEGTVTLATPLGYMQLSRSEAAIVGQARSMLAWHERYKFCSTCGSPTELKEAGYKRVCLSEGCSSNKGES